MKRSRIIFIAIVGIAIVIVGAALLLRNSDREQPLVVVPKGPIQVRILTALPVEPWVRAPPSGSTARQSAGGRTYSG